VGEVLHELYQPFLRTDRPFLVMSPQSAEFTKYAANALLSTKISFINEMANLCERMGATLMMFVEAWGTIKGLDLHSCFQAWVTVAVAFQKM